MSKTMISVLLLIVKSRRRPVSCVRRKRKNAEGAQAAGVAEHIFTFKFTVAVTGLIFKSALGLILSSLPSLTFKL